MIIRDILVSNVAPLSKSVAWIKPIDNGLELLVLINGKWEPIASSLSSSLEERIVVIENDINLENIGLKDRVGNLETGYGTISGNLDTLTLSVGTVSGKVETVESYIPTLTTSSNQLADKNFVNSSIATSTATFKGTFNSIANLPTTDVDDNDYAFVVTTDADGNTVYKRYKYSNNAWSFEYDLNNSSFTAAQWAAINSGITSTNAVLKSGTTSASPMTGALFFNNNSYITNASGDVVAKVNNINCFGNVYSTSKIRSLVPIDRVGVSETVHMVESPSIVTITKLTQSEFDALASYTADTEYNIVEE